jgi:hypothetical protein
MLMAVHCLANGSNRVSVFVGGSGTITLKDHDTGATLLSAKIPLTPGPLVVVIKDAWPPKQPKNVETIAASFVPPKDGSAVRLFNLASDVPSAGLSDSSGKQLADGIKYTLGSKVRLALPFALARCECVLAEFFARSGRRSAQAVSRSQPSRTLLLPTVAERWRR